MMKLWSSLLLLAVIAGSVSSLNEPNAKPGNFEDEIVSLEDFFRRLYPPKQESEKGELQPVNSDTAPRFDLPDFNNMDLSKIPPIDLSWLMDKAGKLLVTYAQKGLQYLIKFGLDFLGGPTKLFKDNADFISFGRQLQAACDRIFDGKIERSSMIETPKFDSKLKEDLFNLAVYCLVEARKGKVFQSFEKPNIIEAFEKVASNKNP